jgi:GNAT superfamily N-acetyltransferase
MTDVSIVPATLRDAEAIGELHVRCWEETYGGTKYEAILVPRSVESRVALWRRVLAQAEETAAEPVLIAVKNDEIVGFSAYGPQRNGDLEKLGYSDEVYAIYVRRDAYRLGIGTALMRSMRGQLEATGAWSLWVVEDNKSARQFYERLGGKFICTLSETRPNGVLVEAAYGWGL